VIYVNVTFLENTPYFSASLIFTIAISITLLLFLYYWKTHLHFKFINDARKLSLILTASPHQSITSTEVSELPIVFRKCTHSCTQHPIAKVISFSHLSPTYFSFVTTLSSISLLESYCDAMLDPKWKSAMDEEMTALHANNT